VEMGVELEHLHVTGARVLEIAARLARVEEIAIHIAEQEIFDRIVWRMRQRALAIVAGLQRSAQLLCRQAQAEETGGAQAVAGALPLGRLAAADTEPDEMKGELRSEAGREIRQIEKRAIPGARVGVEADLHRAIGTLRGHVTQRVGPPQMRLRVRRA